MPFLPRRNSFSIYLRKVTLSLPGAVHSFTDGMGILFVIIGMYLSEKKSKKFPWGLYKTENLASVFVGVLIFLSAYEIGKMVYKPSPAGMKNSDTALIILGKDEEYRKTIFGGKRNNFFTSKELRKVHMCVYKFEPFP